MGFNEGKDETDEQAHGDDENHGAECPVGNLAERREMVGRPEMVVVHSGNNSREPEEVKAVQIPTYTEVQAQISAILTRDVQRGISEETAGALATVFTTQSRTDADLFDFIAFAQACHSAADVMRKHGELDAAGLYFAMGQDLLTKAAEAYSSLVAAYGQTQSRH